jgi:hypothetical protein
MAQKTGKLTMSKVSTRGIDSAHKSILMAAIAYNLKKYMKYNPRIVNLMAGTAKASINQLCEAFSLALLSILNCLQSDHKKLPIILAVSN